jgi:ATP-dependent helicase/nuclease subunit B
MLRLILGRSGSGKTYAVRSALKKLARGGSERLMLLVPEQASFENERAMLRLLGARDARRVHVTSFSRLVDAVQRRCGGFAGRRLDDGGRSIFMSLAVEQVRDRLEVYRKSAGNTELVSLMLPISAELKMCGISPRKLLDASRSVSKNTLQRKMEEISLILSAYDALVSQSYVDPLDDLTRLRDILSRHDFFAGHTVMVDSFQSFTVQEYGILELILRQASDVYVTLCAEGLDGSDAGLFAIGRSTAKKLIRIASENNVPVAAPVFRKSGFRFQNPALSALEAGAYRPVRVPYDRPCGGVAVYEAKNRYDEAAFVCAAIRNLVRKKGYRYRDFAVIARSTGTYEGILDTAMERWEIPYFMDRPEAIDAEPLMRLVLSAFRILQTGFRSDDIFLYLKTGLAGLSTRQISDLENYTFVWNLSGKKWKEAWTDHPDGFSGEFSERDRERLERINQSRRAVVEPLEGLMRETEQTDGEGMAAAAYNLLRRVGAAENLRAYAGRIARNGDPALAERELRVWDLLMKILDQTALVIGKSQITRERYAELLRLVIRTGSIASIPQGLDEVTVGDADRIRTAEPKVVFLIGAAQGEFPLTPGNGCVFSDRERRELVRLGLPLNDTMEGVALRERFLAYSAMSAASERLYLTYPAADGAGKALSPSSIPGEARAVLRKIAVRSETETDPRWFACAEAPALELAARKWNANDTLSASLKDLLGRRKSGRRLAAVGRAAKKEPVRFADSGMSRALFGNDMKVSATQIEKFELCRFQYFCRYGLNVRERRAAELNALEYGSLMHFLLKKLFEELGSKKILALRAEELHRMILSFLDEYVARTFGGLATRTPRFSYLVSRISDSAQIVAVHIARELSQSGFRPADFELEIGGSVGALVISLPDGGAVRVDGKIDRVDLMDRGGVRYIRIVDYKTGKKDFRLSDVLYGMNMQMLVYLAALCENGGKRYGKFRPAGVLYMPANRPSVPAERGADGKTLESKAERQLRMDGLVLDDPEIIAAMDRDRRGQYLPVALKDGMPDRKDHVASPRELEAILEYLRDVIFRMAEELREGNIAAEPLNGRRYDACEWCPYHPVCGHERDDPEREMQEWDRDAVIRELTEAKGDERE